MPLVKSLCSKRHTAWTVQKEKEKLILKCHSPTMFKHPSKVSDPHKPQPQILAFLLGVWDTLQYNTTQELTMDGILLT